MCDLHIRFWSHGTILSNHIILPGLKAGEHFRCVNIGPRGGLVPSGNKPLPKSVLTNISDIKVMAGPRTWLGANTAQQSWQIVNHINNAGHKLYFVTYPHTILRHGIFGRYLKHLPNCNERILKIHGSFIIDFYMCAEPDAVLLNIRIYSSGVYLYWKWFGMGMKIFTLIMLHRKAHLRYNVTCETRSICMYDISDTIILC